MSEHTGSVGPPIRANQMEPEVLRQMLQIVLPAAGGVIGSGDLAVTQNGTPNMQVLVAAGFAAVPGSSSTPTQGAYPVYNDAGKLITIAASDPTNPRNDLIVATVRDSYYAGAQNDWVLQVITGIANAVPVDPAVPANSLVLARIAVPRSVASIVNAYITDLRRSAIGLPLFGNGGPIKGVFGAGQPVQIQTGYVAGTTNGGGHFVLTLPRPFPNCVLGIACISNPSVSSQTHLFSLVSATTTLAALDLLVIAANTGANIVSGTIAFTYIAIGN